MGRVWQEQGLPAHPGSMQRSSLGHHLSDRLACAPFVAAVAFALVLSRRAASNIYICQARGWSCLSCSDASSSDPAPPRAAPRTCHVVLSQEMAAGLTGSVQYRLGVREMVGARATWGNRGRAGVSLR